MKLLVLFIFVLFTPIHGIGEENARKMPVVIQVNRLIHVIVDIRAVVTLVSLDASNSQLFIDIRFNWVRGMDFLLNTKLNHTLK